MNSKFFDVKKEKQDSIINAALRIFTIKGYKDASTDVIVKEAGISKGLLFHYFISKQGLYEFICDYSSKYMTLELTRSVKTTERDFFVILSQIEMGRCRVARNYPYMHQFLRSAKFEKEPEAIAAMGDSLKDIEITYSNIYSQINPKKFINPQDSSKVIEIIDWINDGFMKSKLSNENLTPDELNEEFAVYLDLLRRHFYKSEEDSTLSIAKEEVYERDETIMDSMRMEMTFEERLQAGKRPLVELSEEELARLAEEDERRAAEAEKAKQEAEQNKDSEVEFKSEYDTDAQVEVNEVVDQEDNVEDGVVNNDVDPSSVNIVTSNILTTNTMELPKLDLDNEDQDEFFDDEDEDSEETAEANEEGKVITFTPVRDVPITSRTEPILPTFEAQSVITSKPLNPTVVVDESKKEETIEDIINEAENNLKDSNNN